MEGRGNLSEEGGAPPRFPRPSPNPSSPPPKISIRADGGWGGMEIFRWEYVSRRGARKERFCCVGARPGGIVRGKDARVSRLDEESPMRIECEMKVECPEAPFPVCPFQGEDMLRRVVLAALLVLGWFSADAQAHALLAKELASGDARVVEFSYSTGDVRMPKRSCTARTARMWSFRTGVRTLREDSRSFRTSPARGPSWLRTTWGIRFPIP